jgi:hypothetical protein
MNFLAKHGRSYASKHEVNSRFQVFSQNYDMIEEHNNNNMHFKKTINKFADLTDDEFHELYLGGINIPERKLTTQHKPQ